MALNKKPGIFYGWWIIAACFLMALYSAGVIGYSFTAFIEPIAKEFGWSYANISFASSLRGVEAGLLAPIVGLLVDRFGAKPILFVGAILTGLGILALSRVTNLAMFYAAFALIATGLSACSATAMIAAVSNWFHRRASLAMGIMISGWGFSGFMVPIVVKLIDSMGWRQSFFVLGIGMFILAPLSLMVRRRPEDYGLLPDGDSIVATSSGAHNHSSSNSVDVNLSGKQALLCPTFWYISLALSAQHLLASAVTTHVMPYLGSVGIVRDIAGLAATGIPVLSIIGRFGFGWLGDRVSKKKLTAVGFAMLCVGLLIFSSANPNLLFLLLFFVAFFGIGFGGTNTMRAVLTRDFFGAKNFATIYGFLTGVGTVGSIIGAPLAGYVYDKTGNYRPVWVGLAVLAIACLITIVKAPPVKGQVVQAPAEEAKSGATGES